MIRVIIEILNMFGFESVGEMEAERFLKKMNIKKPNFLYEQIISLAWNIYFRKLFQKMVGRTNIVSVLVDKNTGQVME